MFQRFKNPGNGMDLRYLHFIYLGRKWCSALNACVLSEAFMILCPPDDLFSSVKLETVAVENEDREGFSMMLFKVLVVVLILFWLFWFIFLR